MNCSNDPVEIAVRTIELARKKYPRFASGSGFMGTCHLNRLMRAANCNVVYFPFESELGALALPPWDGSHPAFINTRNPREDRVFAELHELHHVLAGDADELVRLSRDDYMSTNERAADLFAFAELIPSSFMCGYHSEAALEEDIRASVEYFIAGWPNERISDRTTLRLRLFGERAI